MSQDSEKPLRLFVDPFAAWRQFALKTAEMIAASACAGAAQASAVRVAVIDNREPARAAALPTAARAAALPTEMPEAVRAPKAKASALPASKARGRKKHKKRARRQ